MIIVCYIQTFYTFEQKCIMKTIKNLKLLYPIVSSQNLEKMESAAGILKRFERVDFKVMEVAQGLREITVMVSQGKNPSGNYLTDKDLIERGKSLFQEFLPSFKINIQPVEFQLAPVEIVTTDWIQERMLVRGVALKQLVNDTGIDKASLSAVINGLKPLSRTMKGLFYYYFKKSNDSTVRPVESFTRFHPDIRAFAEENFENKLEKENKNPFTDNQQEYEVQFDYRSRNYTSYFRPGWRLYAIQ